MIKTVIKVAASREDVFKALIDLANYARWVPGCERCEIVKASGNTTDVEVSMNSMKHLELGLRFEWEPTQSVRFRMTHGKEIKGYSGTYRLMDSADRKGTVLIAELEIDGGFLAPKFIVDRVATKVLEDTGEALKKYIQSIGRQTAAAAPGSGSEVRKKRDKRIVRVVSTPAGYSLWLYGKKFFIDGGNL